MLSLVLWIFLPRYEAFFYDIYKNTPREVRGVFCVLAHAQQRPMIV